MSFLFQSERNCELSVVISIHINCFVPTGTYSCATPKNLSFGYYSKFSISNSIKKKAK